jgi:hypothetical protein
VVQSLSVYKQCILIRSEANAQNIRSGVVMFTQKKNLKRATPLEFNTDRRSILGGRYDHGADAIQALEVAET